MALSIICPGCEADYSVPENLLGKTIRCKKCGEMIAVKAPKAKARVSRNDDEEDEKPRRAVSRRTDDDDEEDEAPRRSSSRRREDDDDDYDDAPRKKKGLSPVLIGGLAALVLGGGAAAYFVLAGDSKPDQASVTPAPVRSIPSSDPKPADQAKPAEEKKAEPVKADVKATEPEKKPEVEPEKKPEPKPAKSEPVKKAEPKPGMLAASGVASQPGGYELGLTREQYRSGDLMPVVLDRVKSASVFIKTDMDEGSATGSGWFGIEPGIVFTNAHVLNMTAPNAPPPKRLTFYLNAGTKNQRVIPNANIKILAVDREIDLACLQVINEKDLPLPLKVRPSGECTEGLGLNTIGYPFGYMPGEIFGQSKKEPEVSIRRTTITAFRRNNYGILRRVQVEGAANPGNSGGPVVDAEGSVCCVIVEGVHHGGGTSGIALTGCVPTEYSFALLAGRIGDVEYGMPYKADGKVRIPVKAFCLDPFNRLKKVGVNAWVGNNSEKYRSPGPSKPNTEAGDASPVDVALTIDPKTHIAKGEIELPALSDGTVYWGQPYFENAVFSRYYQPGTVIDTHGPPADRVPAVLAYKPKFGSSRMVSMYNSHDLSEASDEEGEVKSKRALVRAGLSVRETTQKPNATDSVQAAKILLNFEELEMPKHVAGQGAEQDMLRKEDLRMINSFIKQTSGVALVNKLGEVYKPSINTMNITSPVGRFYVPYFTNDAIAALTDCAIQMPDPEKEGKGEVKPGQTWKWIREGKINFQDRPRQQGGGDDEEGGGGGGGAGGGQPRNRPAAPLPPPRIYRFQEEWEAKYVGMRERAGNKEAVVEVLGKVVRAPGGKNNAHGEIKGYVLVELDTGTILDASLEKDFTIDTSERGLKKSASGLYKYKITRGAAN